MITRTATWGTLFIVTACLIFIIALPACENEDSRNCIWRADQQGNGVGQSFIDIGGYIIRLGQQ